MKTNAEKPKGRHELLDEALPQFESFVESKETYIRALETTIEALRQENTGFNKNNLAIRSSIDELVAMQRLSSIVSTAVNPEAILSTLFELTQQVISVLEANIFLFDLSANKLLPLSPANDARLKEEAQQQLESGICDWVFAEKKTVIIPDLESLVANGTAKNFVIVPLMLRNRAIGIYLIHTEKMQQDFSNQDIQLLSVLANQAAAGVENWRTYEQLINANKQLKASEAQMIQAAKLAAIGELAASIVHEIKNPIQVLVLQMDMMARGIAIPNGIELVHNQVDRLKTITARLMNFSRNVSDDVAMQPIDINKAIEDVIAMVQHEYRNDKIDIETALSGDLPPVIGNANYLQQVFLNLAINSRDAMPRGGKIFISSMLENFNITVRFSDTGGGIPAEYFDKIFQPFFTTKGEGKGTGLGLGISRNIISQHQGTMRFESEPNRGTTFIIHLPIRRSQK
jgi:signal transduction histidine kinase